MEAWVAPLTVCLDMRILIFNVINLFIKLKIFNINLFNKLKIFNIFDLQC